MIYEISQDIAARLTKRKFPAPVIFGPEPSRRASFDPAIVFERETKPDAVLPPQQAGLTLAIRELSAVARVYMNSALDGAQLHNHQSECEQYVDALTVAFFEWAKEKRSRISYVEARYLTDAEIDQLMYEGVPDPPEPTELPSGVVYMIRFRAARGVTARDYDSLSTPSGSAAGVKTKVLVQRNGTSETEQALPR